MSTHYCTLTVVRCNLLPTPTAVSAQSKRASWCNSRFIHCTKIEVGDGVWGCTRARHWASGVRGGSPSPVLHRVTSDHLTSSQCWSAPSDSDFACFIQCHHWHTTISGWRCICSQWSIDEEWIIRIWPEMVHWKKATAVNYTKNCSSLVPALTTQFKQMIYTHFQPPVWWVKVLTLLAVFRTDMVTSATNYNKCVLCTYPCGHIVLPGIL